MKKFIVSLVLILSAAITSGQQSVFNFIPTTQSGGGTAGVASYNSRTGTVVPVLNDYSFSLLSGSPSSAQITAGGGLLGSNNLSDITSASIARTNLGLGTVTNTVAGRSGTVVLSPADIPGLAASATTDTTNAANISSGTVNSARLPAATISAQGATKLGNPALGINHVTWQTLVTGDSYMAGQGADPLGLGYAFLINQDIPAMNPPLYKAVSGTWTSQIVNTTLLNWIPSALYPSVLITNGGNNDWTVDTCSRASSSNCITNYQQEMSANAMWAAIPFQQRLCASSGAVSAGTWTSNVTVPFSTYNCSTITTGNALASSVSSSTLTFSVPNTNNGYIGVNQITANANTGTYTISIGGVLQTNPCPVGGTSNTTTFSSGPCGGTAMPSTPSAQRNQFFNAAWAGQATQVVITTTNAASSVIAAVDYAVTTWPANTSSAWINNSGAAFDQAPGPYSAAIASLVTSLRATGANVFLVDIRTALSAMASGGVSITPTSDCAKGSLSGNHAGNCGQLTMYNTLVATEAANNYIFSFPHMGGTTGTNQGVINATLMISPQQANVAVGAVPIIAHNLNVPQIASILLKLFDQGTVGAGLHFGQSTMPDGTTAQNYLSMFGSNSTAGPTYGCFEPAPTGTASILANTVWVPTACIKFLTGDFTTKGSFNSGATQTTVSCSTSGNVVFSQPFAGASNKKIVIQENACIGTASYTYPTAFTIAPSGYGSLVSTITTATTTAVTITGTTSTGSVLLEAY